MGLVQTVKNWFYKGGAAIGMIERLQLITDHPKISADPEEYRRIEDSMRLYSGKYDKISYLNSNKEVVERDYITLNMIKIVTETIASLIFNEQCEITVAGKKKIVDGKEIEEESKADIFIQHVMEHNDFKKNFSKYLEPMLASGGLVARPYVDTSNYEIEFSWGQAPAFYPLRSNTNNISECALATKTSKTEGDKTYYYTLLEFHEWRNDGVYTITNELYRSEQQNEVGVKVSLKDIYPDLPQQSEFKDLSRPQFAYLKPAGFNNINPYSPLGLGVCDNCKSTLKQINDTFDQFNWEIQMGQRKVIVSDHFLNTSVNELKERPTQTFDDKTNVFVGLKVDQDDMSIKDITHDIRTESYVGAINQFFKTLEMQTKLSVGTFSFDGASVKTATEVVSENSMTYRTRNSHIIEVEKFIKELIVSVFELANKTIGKDGKPLYDGEIPTFEEIGIDFDDGIFVDKNQQLDYYSKVKSSKFMPDIEIMQRLFKIPEETAIEWSKRISEEELQSNPDHAETIAAVSMLGPEEV